MMTCLCKRILWVFFVLYVNLSSSYFIKVQARSKKQEVDLFIQKLLDSDKFEELADKIAMKAVQRINSYNENEVYKKLRSGVDLDEQYGKNYRGRESINDQQFSTRALTSDEKKTTVIRLKYKQFTKNIQAENNHLRGSKNISTTRDEDVDEFTTKDDISRRPEKKVDIHDNSEFRKEIGNTNKHKTTKDSESDDAEFTTKKEPKHHKKIKTKKSDVDNQTSNTKSSTQKTTTKTNNDNDDSDDGLVTKKATKGSKTSTQRIKDDDDEDDFLNKFGASENKLNEVKRDDDDAADFDFMNKQASEDKDKDNSSDKGWEKAKIEKEVQETKGSLDASETVQKQKKKNKHKKKSHHTKSKRDGRDDIQDEELTKGTTTNDKENFGSETEDRVTKDNGHADPEENDNQSTGERLINNKILVRREGNNLYAQNLEDYEDYRAQLAAEAKSVGPAI